MKRKTSHLVIFRHLFALVPIHVPAHVLHVKFLVLRRHFDDDVCVLSLSSSFADKGAILCED